MPTEVSCARTPCFVCLVGHKCVWFFAAADTHPPTRAAWPGVAVKDLDTGSHDHHRCSQLRWAPSEDGPLYKERWLQQHTGAFTSTLSGSRFSEPLPAGMPQGPQQRHASRGASNTPRPWHSTAPHPRTHTHKNPVVCMCPPSLSHQPALSALQASSRPPRQNKVRRQLGAGRPRLVHDTRCYVTTPWLFAFGRGGKEVGRANTGVCGEGPHGRGLCACQKGMWVCIGAKAARPGRRRAPCRCPSRGGAQAKQSQHTHTRGLDGYLLPGWQVGTTASGPLPRSPVPSRGRRPRGRLDKGAQKHPHR